jgi:hypothetical protein
LAEKLCASLGSAVGAALSFPNYASLLPRSSTSLDQGDFGGAGRHDVILVVGAPVFRYHQYEARGVSPRRG